MNEALEAAGVRLTMDLREEPAVAAPVGEAPLLGLWAVTATPAPVGVAFSTQPAAPPVVWQIDLPASPERAAGRLAAAEASLAAYPWALARAQARLDGYMAQPARVDVAFSPGSSAGPAEQALNGLLAELASAPGPVSFGWREAAGDGLAGAAERCEAFLNRLAHQLAYYAWVETRQQGRLLAWTAAGWTGDARTTWLAGVGPLHVALHHRSLALAMDSRLRLLETLAFIGRNAVRLARLPVLLSLPGGALLALPLAWKFFEDVRRELDRS
jgi:hypothetical protein